MFRICKFLHNGDISSTMLEKYMRGSEYGIFQTTSKNYNCDIMSNLRCLDSRFNVITGNCKVDIC